MPGHDIITAGAGILGWVAGEMAATDPAIAQWVEDNASWLHWVAPALGAVLVIAVGKWLAARAAKAHGIEDLAREEHKA